MPGKSKHRKRRLPVQRKNTQTVSATPPLEAATPRSEVIVPRARPAPAPSARPGPVTVGSYPYLAGELRMIAIMASIVAVILVVLVFVLS